MIIVSSLKDFADVCESINPSHLISVIDPGFEPETPTNLNKHLKLGFDDIVEIKEDNLIYREKDSIVKSKSYVKQILPNIEHINKIIDFISTWDRTHPMLIHCWCGVSRSMATAIFILCKINLNNVDSNVKYMRHIAPHANPNKLMVSMFEEYLGIPGEISEALKKYPYTVTYDCETNFAPVSIFSTKEIIKYK